MATGIRRNERDIDFLVLCQKKQNRKVLTNSVTMLSTLFKVVAQKNTELQKKAFPPYGAHTPLLKVPRMVLLSSLPW